MKDRWSLAMHDSTDKYFIFFYDKISGFKSAVCVLVS